MSVFSVPRLRFMHRSAAAKHSPRDRIARLLTRGAHPHPGFGWTVLAVITLVECFLVVAVVVGADDGRYAEFREGHSVGVLTALFHGMTAALAWTCLMISWRRGRPRSRWFWTLMTIGFLFFGLDEMLEFHERAGSTLSDSFGDAGIFRNWNDIVVLLYGAAGLSFVLSFRREILRLPRFAEMLVLGFVFYGLSSGIDSVFDAGALKNVPEESAKLLAAAFFSLAGWAALLSIVAEGIDVAPRRRRPRERASGDALEPRIRSREPQASID